MKKVQSWVAAGALILLDLPVVAVGPSLSLVVPEAEKPAALGPVHLAGPGPHAIPLTIRGVPGTPFSLKGELFRRLSTTAAPLASFEWPGETVIPPSGELLIQPKLSFPETSASLGYIARFGQAGFPPLAIIVHPANYLGPLQKLTQSQPLQLVGAPDGLPAQLQESGIRVALVESVALPAEERSIIVWFSGPLPETPKQGRLIVADLSEPGREVWKRTSDGGWTIHLHPASLAPERLTTTAGLNHLLELTTREPIP